MRKCISLKEINEISEQVQEEKKENQRIIDDFEELVLP